jgi:hypothetical protein
MASHLAHSQAWWRHARMRNFLLVLLALWLSAVVIRAQDLPEQQSPSSDATTDHPKNVAAISGTVFCASTGDLLKKAHITLARQDDRGTSKPISTLSDDAGHFSIDDIEPGRYSLFAERNGYIRQHYGQTKPDGPGAVLTVAADQKMTDLVFRLQQSGVITGRVVDEDGDPLPGAQVQAMRRSYFRGKTTFSPVGQSSTDDRGEYRIYGMGPGDYYLLATDQQNYGYADAEDNAPEYAPVYYPNASSGERATAVQVAAGDEIRGVDFVLSSNTAHGYDVTGKIVVGAGDSNTLLMAQVMLASNDNESQDFGMGGMRNAQPDPKDATFEFSHVMPGNYTITAVRFGGGTGNAQETASQQIAVTDSNVSDVALVLRQGINISGHVSVEGSEASTGSGMVVFFSPQDRSFGSNVQPASVQQGGTFAVNGVNDGTYNLQVWSSCHTCYLKAATTKDGADLLSKGMEVGSDSTPSSIELVYSSKTAAVSGTVTAEDDKPAPAAFVVLVPAAGTLNRDARFSTANTDQYGRFDISGVPPGHYSVVALRDFDENSESYTDPDFLKPFADKAQSLDVAEGDHKTLQLELIAVGTDSQ